jgi:hypothetical protein
MTAKSNPQPVSLWIGLPIATLMGPESSETVSAAKAFFTGAHHWTADGEPRDLTVASVTIASQPVGAMFDYLINAKGEMPPDKKNVSQREIGVVGIGMNTVDLLVVNKLAPVERFVAGENIGVRRLLEQTNGDGLYTLAERDDQLRAGTLDLSQAQPIWEREVLSLIDRKWENLFKRFAAIIVVGGGSLLMRHALVKRFGGKCYIPDDPVIATARGLYKYARLKAARTGDTQPILAFDAGFGAIKLVSGQHTVVMQSTVAQNGTRALGKMVGLKSSQRPLHIVNERGSFYMGQGAHNFGRPVGALDFDRLTGSPEMLALFHGALTQYLEP